MVYFLIKYAHKQWEKMREIFLFWREQKFLKINFYNLSNFSQSIWNKKRGLKSVKTTQKLLTAS